MIDPVFILTAVIGGLIVLIFVACIFVVKRVPSLDLKGKKVLITGGSEGIGLAMAAECLRKGAFVCIAARREEVLKQAVAKLASVGTSENRIHYVKMDVADENAVDDAAKEIDKWIRGLPVDQSNKNNSNSTAAPLDESAPLLSNSNYSAGDKNILSPDVVICNAGYSYPARFIDTPTTHAKNQMNVNFFGCVNVVRAFIPSMLKCNSGGRFVLVGSMAGCAPVAGFTIYSASKAAIKAFAASLDMEYSAYNIRTQVVFPPDVATPGYETENKVKSEECKRICAMGGAAPFSSDEMAQATISNIENYSFQINLGFDGHALGTLCATTDPATSTFSLFGQVMFGGILRLVMAVYSKFHYGICEDVKNEEMAKKNKK